MNGNKYGGEVLLVGVCAICVLVGYLVTHDPRPVAPPASPAYHLQLDVPVRDAQHVLSGAPNPNEAPAGSFVERTQADVPTVQWEWVTPAAAEIQSGEVCAQEGHDANGNVVALRDWRPRADGQCLQEDAK